MTDTRRPPYRRAAFALAALLLSGGAFGAARFASRAQAQEPSQGSLTTAPPDAVALMQDLNDVYLLRSVNPLKLTPEQITTLTTELKAIEGDYNAAINKFTVPRFRKNAEAIRDARKKAFRGEAASDEFYTAMQTMEADFLKERDRANAANIKAVASLLKRTLADKQINAIVKLSRDASKTSGQKVQGTADQFLNQYVAFIVIGNPRFVPVLQELKAGQGGTK